MKIISKEELQIKFDEIVSKIKKGAVFIYPTDTIYGIGCDAANKKAVARIRTLKERSEAPFSIWVPSLDWIKEACIITPKAKKWLTELPGPYTLILQLHNHKTIASNVAPNTDFIGIRYPDHWFNEVVKKADLPLVTTSANKTGQPFMTSLEDLEPEIKKGVEFIIYEGEKKARPSKVVNVEKEEIRER